MTYQLQLLNKISEKGLTQLDASRYAVSQECDHPDAIIVRSADMHTQAIPASLKVVGRAGAGTNNIPVAALTRLGIPVLNTPGANANAVKELVIAGLLLACRHLCQAWQFTHALEGDENTLHEEVEKNKKQFVGRELPGRLLAVIGLGAVGVKVANAALALGMRVIGFDPSISIERAWELSSGVSKASTLEEAITQADFISLHVPLLDNTKGLVNARLLALMKKNVILLNFSRQAIVDENALKEALNAENVDYYVCDFPSHILQHHPRVIALPHLGASTLEAEETCAVMIVQHVRAFLESGDISYSVNFPTAYMPRAAQTYRLSIVNANIPNMLGQISTCLAAAHYNIIDMLNKSQGDIAYTLVDVDRPVDTTIYQTLSAIEGVLRVRII